MLGENNTDPKDFDDQEIRASLYTYEIVDTLRSEAGLALVSALAERTGLKDAFLQERRQTGLQEGIQTGLQHQAEHRLKRPLREEERIALLDKLARVGFDRFSDVLLDSNAEQLAAWIADPDAHEAPVRQ